MDIIRFAIHNPVKVSVGVILVMLFGIIAFAAIPVQLTPNVDTPIITVETSWPQSSPVEVEREVIEEQEDVLADITGLVQMTATASSDMSTIELEFGIGADMSRARQQVSDALREVPDYPDGVEEPVINVADSAITAPVAWLIFSSDDPDYDTAAFFDAADKNIRPLLERIDGVGQVDIFGGREQEVQVRVDPARLAQRGVSFSALVDALRGENVNVTAGQFASGRLDVQVRTVGQYEALGEVQQTIIAYDAAGPIRVQDVAEVALTLEERQSFVRLKGQSALAVRVVREPGANVISVMQDVRAVVDEVNEVVIPSLPYGGAPGTEMDLRIAYDQTVYINDAISLVQTNLVVGGTLAILVLLFFLRVVRPTAIVALAIPISVIGTFVAMTAAGRNLNVVSLAGLAFAVGMVVDAAIVVLENIDRHLGMGKKPMAAAYDGAREVWGAILASTLTTAAVFVPVVVMEEEAGQLFRDIAIAVIAAVMLSLIVSITVIPSASAHFLRPRNRPESALMKSFHTLFGLTKLLGKAADAFAKLIRYVIDTPAFGSPTRWVLTCVALGIVALGGFVIFTQGPGALAGFKAAPLSQPQVILGGVVILAGLLLLPIRFAVVAVFTAASLGGAWYLMPPTTYLPSGNQNIVFGLMLNPPGYNTEFYIDNLAKPVDERVRPYWEAQSQAELADLPPMIHPFTQQPIENIPVIDEYFMGKFGPLLFIGATSTDPMNVSPLADLLMSSMSQVPGSFGFAAQSSIFGRELGGTNTIEVQFRGNELATLNNAAQAFFFTMAGLPDYGPMRVSPDPANFNLAAPELQTRIDRVRAGELGIDVSGAALGIQALIDGAVVGDYRHDGEAIDLRVMRAPGLRVDRELIAQLPLAVTDPQTGDVGVLPLDSIVTFANTDTPQEIKRIEQQRGVTFNVQVPEGMALETAMVELEGILGGLREQGAVPPTVQTRLAGTADKLVQVRESLVGQWDGFTWASLQSVGFSRMFLALLVVYLLMAALFESYLYPLVILFSVPLATVGGFAGLAMVHATDPSQQLDVLTMLGFVILIGIVVNNAILIVHQSLNFMRGLGEGEGDTLGALPAKEAIQRSVQTRIRPIFMTTATSVFGMLPLVLAPGAGSELYRGLGSVVVGGLIVSTLFTLVVVPTLFSLVLDGKSAWYRWRGLGEPEGPLQGQLDAAPAAG